RRGVLRSRREVPRPGQHALYALLPRRHPGVPVSPRDVEDCRLHAAAQPLLDLRQQGSGPAAECDAVDGHIAPVAGSARDAHRLEADGRYGYPRLFFTALGVVGSTAPWETGGVVRN